MSNMLLTGGLDYRVLGGNGKGRVKIQSNATEEPVFFSLFLSFLSYSAFSMQLPIRGQIASLHDLHVPLWKF